MTRPTPRVMVVSCPDADAEGFGRLLALVNGFCPAVESVRLGVCAFGARGPARYFGGEEALARKLIAAAADAGLTCRVGVADDLFAALLAARARETGCPRPAASAGTSTSVDGGLAAEPVSIVPAGGTARFLAGQPVSVLDDGDLAGLLARLGIRTLGALAALPLDAVASRFGEAGEAAHRLASGERPRPLTASQPPAGLAVAAEFDPPHELAEPVVFAAKALAERFAAGLSKSGVTCVRIEVRVTWEDGGESNRLWRHDGLLTPVQIADRVRWQLDGARAEYPGDNSKSNPQERPDERDNSKSPHPRDHQRDNSKSTHPADHQRDNSKSTQPRDHQRDNSKNRHPGDHQRDNSKSNPQERPDEPDNSKSPHPGDHQRDNSKNPHLGDHQRDNSKSPHPRDHQRDNSKNRPPGDNSKSGGGIVLLRLIPDQLVRATGRQLALWGEEVVADKVARAAMRVQALLGHDAVLRPVRSGGRSVGDQVQLRPFGENMEPKLAADRPWPGRIPGPAPAVVYPEPRPAHVTDQAGAPVTVSGRCALSGTPADLAVDGEQARAVMRWAGPWPLAERWWNPGQASRVARFQLVTDDGRAWLAVVRDGAWQVEAGYW